MVNCKLLIVMVSAELEFMNERVVLVITCVFSEVKAETEIVEFYD